MNKRIAVELVERDCQRAERRVAEASANMDRAIFMHRKRSSELEAARLVWIEAEQRRTKAQEDFINGTK